jgi:hypothetical protein
MKKFREKIKEIKWKWTEKEEDQKTGRQQHRTQDMT